MASLTISIDTVATGALALAHEMSEADAQRIFAAIQGLAAPITDQREIPDPNDATKTIFEPFDRPRTLGEALTDHVTIFVNNLLAGTTDYERNKAVAAILATPPAPIIVTIAPGA